MKDNKKIQLRINGAEFFIFKFYILLMSIMTIITVTIIANNFTIICFHVPSLTGVIHFLIAGIRAIKTVAQTFPSLTGVIRFLIRICGMTIQKNRYHCFRPLQGLFVF